MRKLNSVRDTNEFYNQLIYSLGLPVYKKVEFIEKCQLINGFFSTKYSAAEVKNEYQRIYSKHIDSVRGDFDIFLNHNFLLSVFCRVSDFFDRPKSFFRELAGIAGRNMMTFAESRPEQFVNNRELTVPTAFTIIVIDLCCRLWIELEQLIIIAREIDEKSTFTDESEQQLYVNLMNHLRYNAVEQFQEGGNDLNEGERGSINYGFYRCFCLIYPNSKFINDELFSNSTYDNVYFKKTSLLIFNDVFKNLNISNSFLLESFKSRIDQFELNWILYHNELLTKVVEMKNKKAS